MYKKSAGYNLQSFGGNLSGYGDLIQPADTKINKQASPHGLAKIRYQ
jgi:hypothetical protein